MWSRALLRAIYDEIQRASKAAVAPWTIGNGQYLDLSSPNIRGHLPVSRGGTGGASLPLVEGLYWDGEALMWSGDGLYWG